MQCEDGQPELIVTLEHEHHAVAPCDAQRGKIVCRAVGEGGDFGERKVVLLLIVGEPKHRTFIGTLARERVDNVVTEVEVIRRQQLDAGKTAVSVDLLTDEVVVDQTVVFCIRCLRVCRDREG